MTIVINVNLALCEFLMPSNTVNTFVYLFETTNDSTKRPSRELISLTPRLIVVLFVRCTPYVHYLFAPKNIIFDIYMD